MKAIVVVDQNWAIGKDGGLLVHLSGDLKHFKEITLGKTVIMGRATLQSLPKQQPLPGRKNIVLTENARLTEDFMKCDFTVCSSMGTLFTELIANGDMEDSFVIGGEKIYKQLLEYCTEVYITKIDFAFPGADKHFPNLDMQPDIWEVISEEAPITENGHSYHFMEYRRK
ncbi:dihydrofolate reductase [Anaerovorax sp. IOR16]|uniref:dihydrofolate reductase n=1 Tax=Anaerovorax sp. IOR16 TaxID=2773458 RepID=UPI0019D01CFC|nr:dihydrofolate reductase [Anaerovorax sp. IOR16]